MQHHVPMIHKEILGKLGLAKSDFDLLVHLYLKAVKHFLLAPIILIQSILDNFQLCVQAVGQPQQYGQYSHSSKHYNWWKGLLFLQIK